MLARGVPGLVLLLLIPACGGSPAPDAAAPQADLAQAAPVEQAPPEDVVLGTGQPPFVRIVSPGPGTTVPEGATLTVQAVATSPDTVIALAELYDNDRRVAIRTAAPFLFPLGGLAPGTHVLTVVATDVQGLRAVSDPVTVFVVNR